MGHRFVAAVFTKAGDGRTVGQNLISARLVRGPTQIHRDAKFPARLL